MNYRINASITGIEHEFTNPQTTKNQWGWPANQQERQNLEENSEQAGKSPLNPPDQGDSN
ncbi:MAG: hypothetical protein COV52_02985 [Gammaproteobacteria bacterium CG11_big_fil_rev_8_21_14_0_20_46_22]|nr:MAG: hypothetical protein COW05_02075 [Gammaproteobacteria bacterium CG12_big_fil_rev_8_21_14_0_65_46_12]PIR11740.1 MAG: hypothetical protein COV52_02985 [Gammaproteobacteria bacterium CG11_big_fil_rev_8_21_14_0_20_46_22]